MLRSAICIQPLTSDQIDRYFAQAGKQLESLKIVLRQDDELQELATSPLMLSIMSLAYQDFNREDIIQGGTTKDYRQRLFNTYIDRMFQRRGATRCYSRQQTQRWLIWLAQHLTIVVQTEFLIEQLQQSWLLSRRQQIVYRIFSSWIGGLGVIFTSSLSIGLIAILRFDLNTGARVGLVGGLTSGIVSSLIVCLTDKTKKLENG